MLLCINFGNFCFAQNLSIVDSLESVLKTLEEDTLKINTLLDLTYEFRRLDKEKSISYGNQALELSREIKYKKGEGKALYFLAITLNFSQQFKKSIFYSEQALEIFVLLNDEIRKANCISHIGGNHMFLGDYSTAIEYMLECIPIYESLKDSIAVANTYNNVAMAYFNIQNREKAEECLIKAAKYLELLGDDEKLLSSYLGLGNVKTMQKQYKEAEDYYNKSIEIARKLGIIELEYKTLSNVGIIYNYQEKYGSAIKVFNEVINYFKNGKAGNLLDVEIAYTDLSTSYIGLKQWDKALSCLDSASYYSSEETYLLNETMFGNYSIVYEKKGNFKKALEAEKEYNSIRDSAYRKENSDKINELTIQFETEQKEKEIVELEAEQQLKKLELSEKTNERNITIGISGLLLIGLVFSIFFWKQKQHNATKTIALNQEKINTLLKENEISYVNAMIEGQETERKRIAADLHDRLGSMLATVKLHFSSGKKQEVEKAQTLLDQSVEEVRKISHNLASSSLVKFGLIASLQSLSESISSNKFKVDFLHHGIEERLSSETEISLYRCVQELISNIIKHAKATKITIQLQKNNNDLNLIVEDNGIGFDADQISSGIGLKNITARVKLLKGNIAFDSSVNKGTTVIIDIPLES